MEKSFWSYFSINPLNIEYAEWFNSILKNFKIITISFQKENDSFAFLDTFYNHDLTRVEQSFLTAQRICSPYIKGQVSLPSKLENLLYLERTFSECILKVKFDLLNLVNNFILKEHNVNLNLALSKAPDSGENEGYSWTQILLCILVISGLITLLLWHFFKPGGGGDGGGSETLVKTLLTKISELTEHIEILQRNLAERAAEIAQLTAQAEQSQGIIGDLQGNLAERVSQVAELTRQVEQLQEIIGALRALLGNLFTREQLLSAYQLLDNTAQIFLEMFELFRAAGMDGHPDFRHAFFGYLGFYLQQLSPGITQLGNLLGI